MSEKRVVGNQKWYTIVWCTITVFLWAGSAPAQTLFQEPTRAVDYTQYTEPDQCVWAAQRLADSIGKLSTTNWDTMPQGKTWRFQPWPDIVRQAAQTCSARWSESAAAGAVTADRSHITAYDFRWLYSLYLIAGRDAEASALLRRREAQIAAEPDSARAELWLTVASTSLAARPLRLATADSLWRQLIKLPDSVVGDSVKAEALLDLRALAYQVGDFERATRLARLAETQLTLMSTETRKSNSFNSMELRYRALKNNQFIHHAERMDSLRRSTQAYVALREEQLQGLRSVFFTRGVFDSIGKVVATVEGDFTFPDTTEGPKSTLGKVSIVWPFGPSCAQEAGQFCSAVVAGLKRMKERFPEVDITLITYTIGSYRDQAPPSTEQEVGLMRDWFLKTLQIPASLHIQVAPFFLLPPADARFVNLPEKLERIGHIEGAKYMGDSRGFSTKSVYVLDREGRFVYEAELSSRAYSEEAFLIDVLDVLTHRKN